MQICRYGILGAIKTAAFAAMDYVILGPLHRRYTQLSVKRLVQGTACDQDVLYIVTKIAKRHDAKAKMPYQSKRSVPGIYAQPAYFDNRLSRIDFLKAEISHLFCFRQIFKTGKQAAVFRMDLNIFCQKRLQTRAKVVIMCAVSIFNHAQIADWYLIVQEKTKMTGVQIIAVNIHF